MRAENVEALVPMVHAALEELVGLLDRQFRFLLEQDDDDFPRELRRTLSVLWGEPRLALLLRETRERVRQLLAQFDQHDRETVERLKELRNRLELQVPALDSLSNHQPHGSPDDDEPTSERFADFDAAVTSRTRLQAPTTGDGSTAGQLTPMLQVLFLRAIYGEDFHLKQVLRQEVRPLQQEFLNVRDTHIRTWRAFYDMIRTEPGSALIYLEACIEAISSARPLDRPPEEWRVFAQLGTRRSVQVVFERFKTRCEWYDRERLRTLATKAPGGVRSTRSRPRQIEHILKRELALYLFDQGLNPLVEVPVGASRSDFFEPGSFYLEAKQYSEASPKRKLLQGVSQTYELMANLRGSRHDPSEAYYVVFRLGGPLVQMDDEVSFAGLMLRTMVIDLAPAISSGSRSVGHTRITADEMQEQFRKTAARGA